MYQCQSYAQPGLGEAVMSRYVTGMTQPPSPSEIAREVLTVESDALMQMRGALPAAFDTVVELLLGVAGRVIVSGMGKSGHVAAKIAATMASTGTPAQYVHPGEASHGDLGMVTAQDAVILISNSGETKELADLIAHTSRFSIPMIAITKKPDSTLGRQADHVLPLPAAPEACGIGMAPTTSTTCTMALGDALAVALMRLRGFDRDSFLTFHPGGTLGSQLLKVSAVMHRGTDLAAQINGDLANWIDAHCTFPSTMVDRIVPATRQGI